MKIAILSTKVFTGISLSPWAEALLIEDGRIVITGDNATVFDAAGGDAKIVRLNGGLVTPGLVDAHCHLASLGMTLKQVNLNGTTSLAQCREIIRRAGKNLNPGEWLIGRGWNNHFWEEGREPDKSDLDDLIFDNPVLMTRTCGHLIWVNSKALEVVGIDAGFPEPSGGQIDREDGTGVPTGIIRESVELVLDHLPQVSMTRKKEAILEAQSLSLSYGLTGAHSCENLADYLAFEELASEGKLKMRVCHLLPPEEIKAAEDMGILAKSGTDFLWNTHVKMFMDGSLGADTAYMHEPYEGSSEKKGIACMTREEILTNVENAYASGRSVAIHAIGDRAVSEALDAIEKARETWPGPWRDRIEHVQLCRSEDFERFARLDVIASVQPGFLPTDWKTALEKWGEKRCENGYAWKKFIKRGIRMQFGSDTPVEPNNPLIGLQAAITRKDFNSMPADGWFADQNLSMEEALAGYTKTAAWAAFKEEESGALKPGMQADLTIFEKDLSRVSQDEIRFVKVKATVVGGEIVFGSLD